MLLANKHHAPLDPDRPAILGQLYSRLLAGCLLYTSDAADERSSVDLGGRRIIKKKNTKTSRVHLHTENRRLQKDRVASR